MSTKIIILVLLRDPWISRFVYFNIINCQLLVLENRFIFRQYLKMSDIGVKSIVMLILKNTDYRYYVKGKNV